MMAEKYLNETEDLKIILNIERARRILYGILLENALHDDRRDLVSDDDLRWLYMYLVEIAPLTPFATNKTLTGYDIIAHSIPPQDRLLVVRSVLYREAPKDLYVVTVPPIPQKEKYPIVGGIADAGLPDEILKRAIELTEGSDDE